MKSETLVLLCVALMSGAVLFGLGAVTVLSIQPLADNAKYLLPAVVVSGFLVAPFIAWRITPRLRPRHRRWQ